MLFILQVSILSEQIINKQTCTGPEGGEEKLNLTDISEKDSLKRMNHRMDTKSRCMYLE